MEKQSIELRLLALEEKNTKLEEEFERTKAREQIYRQKTEGRICDLKDKVVKLLHFQLQYHVSGCCGVADAAVPTDVAVDVFCGHDGRATGDDRRNDGCGDGPGVTTGDTPAIVVKLKPLVVKVKPLDVVKVEPLDFVKVESVFIGWGRKDCNILKEIYTKNGGSVVVQPELNVVTDETVDDILVESVQREEICVFLERPTEVVTEEPVDDTQEGSLSAMVVTGTTTTSTKTTTTTRSYGEKSYQCKQCEKSFTTSTKLKLHTHTHTDEKLFKCQVCDKKFACKIGFIRHNRTHIGKNPYRCQVCEKSFSRKSHLKVHLRTHTLAKSLTNVKSATHVLLRRII